METRFHLHQSGKRPFETEENMKIADEIIEVIKKYRPTYAEAYVSLDIVYKRLVEESNYVKVD